MLDLHIGKFQVWFRNHIKAYRKLIKPRYEITFDNNDKYIGLNFSFGYLDLRFNKFK